MIDQPKCATCRHSIGSLDGLLCQRWARPAVTPCRSWQREPGADDAE